MIAMDWHHVLQQIAQTVVEAAVIPTVGLAVSWVCQRLWRALGDARLKPVRLWIGVLVKAAQQSLDRPERKAFVVDAIRKRFPWVPANLLDALIEAAVHDLKQGLAAPPPAPEPPK